MSIDRRSFLKLLGATAATVILPEPKEIALVVEDVESCDPERQRVILSIYDKQHALVALVLADTFDISTWRGSIHEVNLTFRSSRHWMAFDDHCFDFTLYLPETLLWVSSRYAFSGTLHITGGTLYPSGPPSYSVQVLIAPEGISCTYYSATQGQDSMILIPGNQGSETDFVSIEYEEEDPPEDQACSGPKWSFRS